MKKLPNAIVIVDGKTESIAIQEAKKLEIPIICIVDSNTDPTLCDFPIPANDDSIRTIQLIINEIVNTIVSSSKKDESDDNTPVENSDEAVKGDKKDK